MKYLSNKIFIAVSVIIIFTILIPAGLLYAEEMDQVTYTIVADKEGLKDYIDNDGDCASNDTVKNGESKVYKLDIEEPGTLFICPIDADGHSGWYNHFKLYSNKSMTSLIFDMEALIGSSRPDKFGEVHVDPGSFYYYTTADTGQMVVFLGFAPDDESIAEKSESNDTVVSEDSESVSEDISEDSSEDISEESLRAEIDKLNEKVDTLYQILEQAGFDIESDD